MHNFYGPENFQEIVHEATLRPPSYSKPLAAAKDLHIFAFGGRIKSACSSAIFTKDQMGPDIQGLCELHLPALGISQKSAHVIPHAEQEAPKYLRAFDGRRRGILRTFENACYQSSPAW